MNAFTIKDLENLSGIKAHTIRIWEQRYHFLQPQRTETNIRYYSNEELKMLLDIALLNKYGYKISHIDKMQPDEITVSINSLQLPEAIQDRVLSSLIKFMVDMEVEASELMLNDFVSQYGIDKAIDHLVFPFLEKMDILWQTSPVYAVQENLFGPVIRQKLVVAIESLPEIPAAEAPVVLFLPENEFHELGLLLIYYLQKRAGRSCIYLGASVPLKELEFIVKQKQPASIQTHLTSVSPHFSLERYMNKLHQRILATPVFISGAVAHEYKKSLPDSFSLLPYLADVRDHIVNSHHSV